MFGRKGAFQLCLKTGALIKVLGMIFQTLWAMALKDLPVIDIDLILGTFGRPVLVDMRVVVYFYTLYCVSLIAALVLSLHASTLQYKKSVPEYIVVCIFALNLESYICLLTSRIAKYTIC